MTIQKQVDNLIDWYAQNKPSVKEIVLACSRGTVAKFAPCEITFRKVEKGGRF